MKLLKYAIYYTFIGFYQTGIFIKQLPTRFQNTNVRSTRPSSYRVKTTLLRTAFRSIL